MTAKYVIEKHIDEWCAYGEDKFPAAYGSTPLKALIELLCIEKSEDIKDIGVLLRYIVDGYIPSDKAFFLNLASNLVDDKQELKNYTNLIKP